MKTKPQKRTEIAQKEGFFTSSEHVIFYLFSGFLLLFIPFFQVKQTLDFNLMPRMTAMGVSYFVLAAFVFRHKFFSSTQGGVLRNPVFPILLAYLLVSVVSLFFSAVYQEGVFDVLRTVLFVSTIAFASIILIKTPGWEHKISLFVMVAALIAVAVGFFQYVDRVLYSTLKELPDHRPTIYLVDGTMLHKNEYSNALMLLLPFLGYGVYAGKKAWRFAFGAILLAVLGMILLLKTRAVWLGVIAAVMLLVVVAIFQYKKLGIKPLWRNIAAVVTLFFLGALALVFSLPRPKDSFSILGRIWSVTDTTSEYNIHRLSIWRSTVDMIKDHFWLGVGPGNWRLEYYDYIGGVFNNIIHVNWGQPHNDFLWVFAEKGVFGILTFLSFFGYNFYMAWRIISDSPALHHRKLALMLLGGLVSYLVISAFSFPYERIDHTVSLGLLSAGLIVLYYPLQSRKVTLTRPFLIAIPVMVSFIAIVWYGYWGIQQEIHLRNAISANKAQKYELVVREAELSHHPFRLIDVNSRHNGEYIAEAYEKMNKPEQALMAIDKSLAVFPESMSLQALKGHYLFELKRYEESLVFFQKALKVVPQSKEILSNCGAAYFQLGQYDKALESQLQIPNPQLYPDVIDRIKMLQNLVARPAKSQ